VDDRRLRELLIQTDAAAAPPETRDLLGGAIRRRFRRRRNTAIGAMGAILLATMIAIRLARPVASPYAAAPVQGTVQSSIKIDPVAVAIQLDVATRTVDGLLQAERRQSVDERSQRLEDERIILRQEREEEAKTALASAAELTDGSQAAVLRRIVQCYSGTGAAMAAQERLSTIQ
jgi:hypothetical protein